MRLALLIVACAFTALASPPALASPFGRLFAGAPPADLGPKDGRLAPCPARPNCVSSTASDPAQQVAPLRYASDATAAMHLLAECVRAEPGASVVTQRPDYLHAEFASAAFGFVDDVEFHLAAAGRIDVRSASRLGYSDFGVNRDRVEALRASFEARNSGRQP
ncbi:MAG: DUF1499 domain-containing protein [Betaproteobacteria bacterium]|nr:DUF1499 domain-containing protein [Betaproteobacteria bacterium]